MTQPNEPMRNWYIVGESGPEPILLYACTAEERAIIDAGRRYVAAEREMRSKVNNVAEVPAAVTEHFAAWHALEDAVDAATEEGDAHVG